MQNGRAAHRQNYIQNVRAMANTLLLIDLYGLVQTIYFDLYTTFRVHIKCNFHLLNWLNSAKYF